MHVFFLLLQNECAIKYNTIIHLEKPNYNSIFFYTFMKYHYNKKWDAKILYCNEQLVPTPGYASLFFLRHFIPFGGEKRHLQHRKCLERMQLNSIRKQINEAILNSAYISPSLLTIPIFIKLINRKTSCQVTINTMINHTTKKTNIRQWKMLHKENGQSNKSNVIDSY